MVASALGLVPQSLFAASTVQFQTRLLTVEETAGQAELSVVRQDDLETEISVDFLTLDATAIAGLDYTAVSGTVAFLPGETNQTIVVPILNDGLIEPLERFQVALTNVTGDAVLGTMRVATISIRDNETPVQLEFATYWAREDEGSVQIGIVRGGDELDPLTLEVVTADGMAKAGEDYQAVAAEVTFEAGENLKLLSVPILNDGAKETEETFRIYLTNALAGMAGTPSTATITIRDNDPGVQFIGNTLWVRQQEGSITLTVTRGNDGFLEPFTVDFATTNSTAFAGNDYTETNGRLAFARGDMSQRITVPILDDGVAKLDRQFQVVLSNPTGGAQLGAVADLTATVTVWDSREMQPHRFEAVQVSPDGIVALRLGGGYTAGLGLVNRFQPYFDLFPIETSTNLIDWTPFTWVVRTNAVADQLTLSDADSRASSKKYYRTAATDLIAPSPPPTGPYAVGRIDRLLTDPTRRNRYAISTNGSFMLTLWYPAKAPVGQLPTPYDDPAIAQDSWYYGWGQFVDRVAYMVGYSFREAQFAAIQVPCPVVLYSHGLNDYRSNCEDKAEYLASHGYVVVAVDHYDNINTVFPNGVYIKGTEGRDYNNPTSRGLADRVADFQFVMEKLGQWNRDDLILAGRLNLERVAALGYSWGGATVAELCRISAWCRAVVLLDPGGWFGALPQAGLSKPSLTMVRADNADLGVHGSSTKDAVWFQISNTDHLSFSSWYAVAYPTQSHREAARTVNAYLLWFLNKYLKGSTDPMPELADYSRVINFKQK